MILPVQVTFRGIERSPSLEALVQEQAESLDRFDDDLVGCRVVVEQPHKHRTTGRHVHVRIDLTTAGGHVVVNRDPKARDDWSNPEFAVREAFRSARRGLQDYVRRRRGDVQDHVAPDTGRVVDLAEDHGFLLTPDDREVYFHRNAVLGESAWDHLAIGDVVRFVEETGLDGPQASTVIPS